MSDAPFSALPNDLDTAAYDYVLPEGLIASYPAERRDGSRLLVLHRGTGGIEHLAFTDFPRFFGPDDLLVANDTRVLRARLLGRRILSVSEAGEPAFGGNVEMLLLERRGPLEWEGAFKASGKPVPGFRFRVENGGAPGVFITGEIVSATNASPSGTVVARFDRDPEAAGMGELPLPHYFDRPDKENSETAAADEERYQTVFARAEAGSAAAPTAGLHFTPAVLNTVRERGAGWAEVTLNVGLGTFRPVRADRLSEHVMHEERYEISSDVADRIRAHRARGGRVTAIGTTSVRTLESAFLPETGGFLEGPQRTGIFLYPGGPRGFRVTDHLLTNFHLPKSTLLMLVSAFAGRELVLRAYAEAIERRYRFFSYGDAMLIL